MKIIIAISLCIVCVSLTALAESDTPDRGDPPNRPNVLWIFVEDMCPWLGCYGETLIETPHLDSLAEEGVLFEHCYVTAPVCSPCRSAIITGCMQTTLGLHQHRSSRSKDAPIHLPDHVKTLPEIFRKAGYYTYNHGKDDYNFIYDRSKLYAESIPEKNFYGRMGKGDWSEREPGQPFFGQVTLWGGKNNAKVDEPLDPARVAIPPYYPDCPEYRKQYTHHYDQIRQTDAEVGEIISRLKKDGLFENTIIFFFSDHGFRMPRHKQFCYDGVLHVPLLIAWPGRPEKVKPGTKRGDLCSLLDVTATTLALAGLEVPEWMESRNLFSPDFHRNYVIAARDRCDYTIDHIRAVRTKKFKYIRNFLTDRPYLQPQYRDGREYMKVLKQLYEEGKLNAAQSRFVSAERPAEELYDLESDPHEIHDLADDPDRAGTLKEMRALLDRWMKETDDRGQYPESDASLKVILDRWKEKCVNPEFDRVR
ncbi:MAG: sulfatase family protein [Planctomycetota bacterium]